MTSSTWHPQRAIEIVAGTPPGGGLDRAARALTKAVEANRLSEVPVRIANLPGDGGKKCWVYLNERAGDPHVVSISSVNLTTDHLLGVAPFHHERAFTPLAILYTEYIAFVVRADSVLKSSADLLERFAKNAGSVTIALSISLGNPNHIALAKVIRHAGADVKAPRIRVFDSALDAVADALAGNAEVVTASIALNASRAQVIDARAALLGARVSLARAQGTTTDLP